jgi:glycosyltransferase involved in cell wall biosynthesis
VAAVLERSHLFALPSRREAFGLAVLEARAAGLPIVACASGGVPEIVADRRQGLLAHTAGEFADAVATIVNDDGLREQFASASRDGLDAYDWDRVIDRHEMVYHRAIASVV